MRNTKTPPSHLGALKGRIPEPMKLGYRTDATPAARTTGFQSTGVGDAEGLATPVISACSPLAGTGCGPGSHLSSRVFKRYNGRCIQELQGCGALAGSAITLYLLRQMGKSLSIGLRYQPTSFFLSSCTSSTPWRHQALTIARKMLSLHRRIRHSS